jgi:hypothetical protein
MYCDLIPVWSLGWKEVEQRSGEEGSESGGGRRREYILKP